MIRAIAVDVIAFHLSISLLAPALSKALNFHMTRHELSVSFAVKVIPATVCALLLITVEVTLGILIGTGAFAVAVNSATVGLFLGFLVHRIRAARKGIACGCVGDSNSQSQPTARSSTSEYSFMIAGSVGFLALALTNLRLVIAGERPSPTSGALAVACVGAALALRVWRAARSVPSKTTTGR
ncbi:MauE/DoxX family redox-associated membrane protein [Embleya scabrispora]|uniref:MauE/DoxX family redox-associated membrane protein n=1 Tax=Embleya scabrispora TaxID=159449 RepID=UPI001180CF94|nr:MauE/DoxX family redox-associated membrane protein [Embleya scabrispora]